MPDDETDRSRPDGVTVTGNGRIIDAGEAELFEWSCCSEPGEVRPHNEDFVGSFVPTGPPTGWDRGPLFCVADGLGGHAAGEVASRLAVETTIIGWTNGNGDPAPQALRSGVRAANAAILDAAMHGGRRGMGTTLTALTFAGREAAIAHVGDSRAYLVRGEQCLQLTTDHSRVGELLRMKLLTPEQAAHHPSRSQLTRSLGANLTVQVDLVRQGIVRDDVFVLCSDGLWDVVGRAEIAASVARAPLAEAAVALTESAVQRGSADNVSVVVVRVTSDEPVPAAAARRSLFRRGKR